MRPFPGTTLFVLLTMAAGTTCSDPTPAASETLKSIPSTATSPSATSPGVLEGEVLFDGPRIPPSTVVANTTDPNDCGSTQSLEDILISPKNRGIKNVIVTLHGVPLPEDYQPEPSPLHLANRNCQFNPHVSVLTTGSRIDAVNSDPIFHSVHFYGFLNRNLALGPNQSKTVRTVTRPGYYIVKCDVHTWMQAYFRVDDHPFHAVSGVDGKFRIENIPEGSYILEVWHEHFGKLEVEVKIANNPPSHVTIHYGDPSPRKGGT